MQNGMRMTQSKHPRTVRTSRIFLLLSLIVILAFSTTAVAGGGLVSLKPLANGPTHYVYLPQIVTVQPSNLEVTQGVQQPGNPVTLIANRTTYVRYTLTAPTAWSGVNAYLHGTQGGSPLPGSPLSALNNSRTLESSANRADIDDTFNFLLPSSWTSGTVELWGSATNGGAYDIVDGPITVTFNDNDPLEVTVIPIAYTCSSGGSGTTTSTGPFDYLVEFTSKIYPAPSINLTPHASVPYSGACTGGVPDPTYDPSPENDSDWEALLILVTNTWLLEGSPNNYYYGLVDIYCPGSCISGLGWTVFYKAAVGFNGFGPSHSGADDTHAHEVGHNHGRTHAPGCGAGGVDGSYPYVNGSGRGVIGDSGDPNYGFDISTMGIKTYSSYYDVMGYCGPYWVSDYTYEALYDWEIAQPAMASRYMSAGDDALLVSGWLNDDGSVHIEPAFQLDIPALVSTSGEYSLELLDGDGNPLAVYPFGITTAIVDRLDGTSAGEIRSFHLTIPYVPGVEGIQVSKDGDVLGELQAETATPPSRQAFASSSARVEQGVLNAAWTGSPGASYLIRLSLDNGTTWQTVSVNQCEPRIDLPLAVTDISALRLEILTSDGIHTERFEFGLTDITH